MFLLCSLVKIQYCVEPPWPRSSVLSLGPPGFEFRILCLEGSIISFTSPSSGGFPGPFESICAQTWRNTQFISFRYNNAISLKSTTQAHPANNVYGRHNMYVRTLLIYYRAWNGSLNVRILTPKTLKYCYINQEIKGFLSIWNNHKCLSYLFLLHLNTYMLWVYSHYKYFILSVRDRL